MKVSKDFYIQEFVPKETYEEFGDSSIRFIDFQLINIAQFLRDWYDMQIIINDWVYGGEYNYSGFRPDGCPVGAKFSAHKRGMAIDPKFPDLQTTKNVYTAITGSTRTKFYKELRRLGLTGIESNELTKDKWAHLTTENFNLDQIKIIGG